ncbi:MFS transporter [Bradyrhizobium sp. SYSU BS000235]|uniref:MFS transporter n=1 Tax=Bradyrhizobium sp. SYSU BS000235 TaxID=3411332 RepID=UPI003C7125B4
MSSDVFNAMDSAKVNGFHKRVTWLSGMGVFLEGYDFTNIASALVFLVPYFHLTPERTALLAVSTHVGTIIGALLIGYLADRLGRKFMYMTDIVLYAVFAIMSAVATDFWVLVAARIGLGIAIGADQALSFTIIAEFAPRKSRGRLNASTWILWTVASCSAYVLSFVLNPLLGEQTWRVVFALALIPSLIVLIGRRKLPESPRWLIQKGRYDEARAAIAETLENVPVELIKLPPINKESKISWRMLFASKTQTHRTLYICIMWFCVTFNTYGVSYFTPYIFKTLGFTAHLSLLGGVIVSLFAVAGAVIMFLLVDKVGRKSLAVAGFALLAVVDIGIVLVSGNIVFPVLLALFSLFQLFAWVGPAGLVGVVAPEVFPTSIRSFGTGVAAAAGRLGSIVGILLFPILLNRFGLQITMAVFCLDAVIATIAMIVFGTETKGIALEEIA